MKPYPQLAEHQQRVLLEYARLAAEYTQNKTDREALARFIGESPFFEKTPDDERGRLVHQLSEMDTMSAALEARLETLCARLNNF